MGKKDVIILLSGGLDSAITAAYLQDRGHNVKAGVFVNRGQSNYKKELSAVGKVSNYLNIPLYQADFSIPDLGKILPKATRKKMGIPARNLILGSIALPYVHVLNCDILALGNLVSDTYPDNSREFRLKFTEVARQALQKPIDVVAPLADWEGWDKAGEIIYANKSDHGYLFGITWTCWLNREFQCGGCHSCKGRKEAFKKAGIIDPIVFKE